MLGNLVILSLDCLLPVDNYIDFVLEDNNVFKFHDVNSQQMLSCLRLRVMLITSDEKESCIHDGSSCKHGSHKGIVTWAIDE